MLVPGAVAALPGRGECEGNFFNFVDFDRGTDKISTGSVRQSTVLYRPLLCSGPAVLRKQSVGFFV
jgi:hypothetical protein